VWSSSTTFFFSFVVKIKPIVVWMEATVQQIQDRYWYCIVLSLFWAWYLYQYFFFFWWENPLSRIWIYKWKKKIIFVFFVFSSIRPDILCIK
jgi:hypothetical protein